MKALIIAIGILLIGSVAMAQQPDTLMFTDDDFIQGFRGTWAESCQMKVTLLVSSTPPPETTIWYNDFGSVIDSLILTTALSNFVEYTAENVYNGTFPSNAPYIVEFIPFRWVEELEQRMLGPQSDVFYMDVTVLPIYQPSITVEVDP